VILEYLELRNFKNYTSTDIYLDSKFVCFTGKNGHGKTNILDAIHYLSLTKSFQNYSDTSNIKHGENFFRIAGKFKKDNKSIHEVVCMQERNERKKIIVNDKTCERFADHIGEFPVALISPADFDLIYSSDARRRFIDATISQFGKIYLDNVIQYNRTLAQRNKLLKCFSKSTQDIELLQPYNYKLHEYGTPIHIKRKEFLADFLQHVQEYYARISQDSENVLIKFETNIDTSLFDVIEKNLQKDIVLGHTSSGIHREDFGFYMNDTRIRNFASQGQQKSFLIALKLAKHKYLSEKKLNTPLLMIDDIHDKLDAYRVEQLFEVMNDELFTQIFITDTQKERLEPLMKNINVNKLFYCIEYGSLTQ